MVDILPNWMDSEYMCNTRVVFSLCSGCYNLGKKANCSFVVLQYIPKVYAAISCACVFLKQLADLQRQIWPLSSCYKWFGRLGRALFERKKRVKKHKGERNICLPTFLFIVVAEEEKSREKASDWGSSFSQLRHQEHTAWGSPLFKRPFWFLKVSEARERDEALGPGRTKKGFLHSIESIAESKWNGLFFSSSSSSVAAVSSSFSYSEICTRSCWCQ